jgi:hypothetical protein
MSIKTLGVVSKSFRTTEDAVIESFEVKNERAVELGYESVELRMIKRQAKKEQKALIESIKERLTVATTMGMIYPLIEEAADFDAIANKRVGYKYLDTYEEMWSCFIEKEKAVRARIRYEQGSKGMSVWPTGATAVRVKKGEAVALCLNEKELHYQLAQGYSIEAIGVRKSA